LAEIRKGCYGLPQAGILAYERLLKHLRANDYHPTNVPGLFRHRTRPVTFSLVVDDFGVKYVGREHAQHLVDTLSSLYEITIDWTGALYLGITLKWDYEARTVDCSMPGYIAAALERFQHTKPKRRQDAPYPWIAPTYGAKVQYAAPEDESPPLDASGITRLQEVIGTLLYYARAIDSTMLVALSTLSSAQSKGTEATAKAVTHLLNYCAWHPDAILRYYASDMYLHNHSDASNLSEPRARSRAAGYNWLSSRPKHPTETPDPNSTPPLLNGAIHVHCSIMKMVVASAAEAELGALFYNGKDVAYLRNILQALGHPQGATPIQTDNSTAAGIANDTVKQRRSKSFDMRFFWVRDRVNQGEFLVHWRKGSENRADFFSKHSSAAHHRRMRPLYLRDSHSPTTAVI
jgi:hypothetical protein